MPASQLLCVAAKCCTSSGHVAGKEVTAVVSCLYCCLSAVLPAAYQLPVILQYVVLLCSHKLLPLRQGAKTCCMALQRQRL